jgi:glutamine amidotransferase
VSRLVTDDVSIAIVDYGMGNRRSVEKALKHLGVRSEIGSEHDRLRGADGLIVPGVGAFPRAMRNLAELGLDELLRERIGAGTPILGICLGMQLAFDSSTELGGAAGLGLVPGTVEPVRAGSLKLPHIGWNEVRFVDDADRDRVSVEQGREPGHRDLSPGLLAELPSRCAFYHVHSFAPVPANREDVLGTATYGEEFVTAVQRGRFYGVQFHPEKSSAAGLRLLANFARICAAARVAVAR